MSKLARRMQHAVAWRFRAAIVYAGDIVKGARVAWVNRSMGDVPLDPRISYPVYKSFDEFIDVDRLKSLDGFLTEKVAAYLKGSRLEEFETGDLKSTLLGRSRPGSKIISLTVPKDRFSYFVIDQPSAWEESELVADYAPLMDFVRTLPFKQTARIVIMCDDQGHAVTRHRDHGVTNINHEFVWLRTNLAKTLYLQDWKSGRKCQVRSYSAWFDTVNQFHGADRTPKGIAFSIRVDGIFSDEFRRQIPVPSCNPASTSALWASLSNRPEPSGDQRASRSFEL